MMLGSFSLQAGVQLDPSRPHLNALDSRGRLDWADYREDFLISQSAEVSDSSVEELIKKIHSQHQKTLLQLPTKFNFEEWALPKMVVSGDQLEGLLECSREKCAFKLHATSEILPLLKSTDRVNTFSRQVGARLKNYLSEKKLLGYESRDDNVPFVKKALRTSGFLKSRYPKTFEYLQGDFWKNQQNFSNRKNAYLRAEVIHITGDKMQPVYRLVENIEFEEKGYVNLEVHIYTNHFFDCSIRIFEVFPWPPDPKKSVYVVTDIMEIDELKKSALIRNLFKSRMEEAISSFRKSEMKDLR